MSTLKQLIYQVFKLLISFFCVPIMDFGKYKLSDEEAKYLHAFNLIRGLGPIIVSKDFGRHQRIAVGTAAESCDLVPCPSILCHCLFPIHSRIVASFVFQFGAYGAAAPGRCAPGGGTPCSIMGRTKRRRQACTQRRLLLPAHQGWKAPIQADSADTVAAAHRAH